MNVDAVFWIEPDDEWSASLHPSYVTDYGHQIPATCHLRPGHGGGSSIVVQSVEAADRLLAVLTEARAFLAIHEVVDAEIVDAAPEHVVEGVVDDDGNVWPRATERVA